MTDEEREARIGRMYGPGSDTAWLLSRLKEARAAVQTQNGVVLAGTKRIVALEAQVARLRAPPGASAMERAQQIYEAIYRSGEGWSRSNTVETIARAIEDAERAARAAAIHEAARVVVYWFGEGSGDRGYEALREIRARVEQPAPPSSLPEEPSEAMLERGVRVAAASGADLTGTQLHDGWRDIESAPKDGTFVWVWAAPYDTLPGFVEYARYHEDAGWCVDELREVRLWQPAQLPPAPPAKSSDGWIPWSGGKCPVPTGTRVQVRYDGGSTGPGEHDMRWTWEYGGQGGDIIAYRVLKER